ncbi:efflux RND transporter periplasmic adaptor subunit [uncultured Phenylobacterium sp.]|uniref:efflux RND transporter periplasmic adaptor subunit n=1 Tax=uncultured Phenylobacterium sp. TaxID=349273 RepID=UPI0025D83A22|nr:efflux RND transporter periplasmic adaptor subunit [uncultured Phenylobacterium sp.]
MRRTLSLLVVAALSMAACGKAPQRVDAPSVETSGERLTLANQTISDLKPVAATVTTRDMAEARARIGGTLSRLSVKEGDLVRKGQVIGMVTDQRLAFEARAYGAQVAAAAAEAERAAAELKRVEVLHGQGFYATARLEQAQAGARAAQGQLDAVRAQRSAAGELVDQGAVLAPADGRVLRAETPAGSVVSPGQSVATITAGAPLLRLEIPEAQARALKVGDTVAVVVADLPGIAPTGVIDQIYPAVSGGRVVADVSVPHLDASLVGRRVRVRVKVAERAAVILPRRFVSTRYGVDFLRVAGRDGRAADVAVQVTPGPTADQVEVLSGVAAGEVVIAPPRALAEGGPR